MEEILPGVVLNDGQGLSSSDRGFSIRRLYAKIQTDTNVSTAFHRRNEGESFYGPRKWKVARRDWLALAPGVTAEC